MRGPAVVLALLLPVVATAQEGGSSALTDQQRLLALKAAWVTLQNLAAERDRASQLAEGGLLSDAELAAARTAYQVAQVTYQQRFLELFSATPRIAVERCVKSYDGDSRQWVKVVLRNSSAPALDYRSVGIVDEQVPLPDLQRLRDVQNVAVSLTDAEGVIISRPYEQRVARVPADAAVTLRFELLKDVDSVHVLLRYSGREETLPLYLEKDTSANVVRLTSQQFSQEADLGSAATYDLRLERYGGTGNVYRLRVFDLPEEVGVEFVEPDGGARLSQIKFTEGVNTRSLRVRVFLPDVVSDRLALDQALEFWVAALDPEAADEVPEGRTLLPEIAPVVHAQAVRLELVPRGVGKLEVSAPSLFEQIRQGQPARLEVLLRNLGTRGVDNIRLHADAPSDWRVTVEPALTPRLEPGEEVRLEVGLQPPSTVQVGDFPVRLRTEAYADNRRIDSQDQTARIQVVAPPSYAATGLLSLLVMGILGGLLYWGVRVTRR